MPVRLATDLPPPPPLTEGDLDRLARESDEYRRSTRDLQLELTGEELSRILR